eukprot:TRINITY_DN1141_c3_g1_i15.p4 TRINITY_DN1141_c3_g1~~TRINITY_DN1141_c3_g1_i15.p4  ORF type:complete len:101 (+),score=25.10 TRINITY_DN1141_c3_g1_i15:394-696(+)
MKDARTQRNCRMGKGKKKEKKRKRKKRKKKSKKKKNRQKKDEKEERKKKRKKKREYLGGWGPFHKPTKENGKEEKKQTKSPPFALGQKKRNKAGTSARRS